MSFSVVIPAFNAAQYISRAIESALAQTMTPNDIVIVDDGSTDHTADIVRSYGSAVRLISQSNQGVSAARNTGVAQTESNYIAFLDADDFWHAEKSEQQLDALDSAPETAFSYTALRELNPDGSVQGTSFVQPEKLKGLLRICNPGIPPSCAMVRRTSFQATGGFNTALRGCEDWDLWIRLLRRGGHCALPQPLTNYQLHPGSLSSDAALMFTNFLELLHGSLLDGLEGWQKNLWSRRALSYQYYKAALTARASGQRPEELRYFLRSIGVWPSPLWHALRYKSFAISCAKRLRERRP